jgi:hypothetical protein
MISTAPVISELTDVLRKARNADGGWGYYAGKTSRLEPTCWALLGLGPDATDDVLRQWPVQDGVLVEQAGEERPNFGFHGLALLTLLERRIEHRTGNQALVTAIQRSKGIAIENDERFKQDNTLQAWSWIPQTFSWVEPTAYCLLALKKAGRANLSVDSKRIADAEALLFDRCCVSGGWNFGNSRVLGNDLPAYVPTTALALLALQGRASEPAFTVSLAFLEDNALSESSALALSLALLALRVLGRRTEAVTNAIEKQLPITLALGNVHAIGLALFALRTDHGNALFRL